MAAFRLGWRYGRCIEILGQSLLPASVAASPPCVWYWSTNGEQMHRDRRANRCACDLPAVGVPGGLLAVLALSPKEFRPFSRVPVSVHDASGTPYRPFAIAAPDVAGALPKFRLVPVNGRIAPMPAIASASQNSRKRTRPGRGRRRLAETGLSIWSWALAGKAGRQLSALARRR